MHILGISGLYHDSAACMLKDGKVVAAAQEERFTRVKHDSSFPINAIKWCSEESGIDVKDVDFIGFYEKPLLKFDRILETYLTVAPRGISGFLKAMPSWIKEKLWVTEKIRKELGYMKEVVYIPHHWSHAASSFYSSGFDEAAILTVDGVGEWSTTMMGVGDSDGLSFLKEIKFPHSIGLLYSAFTDYLGFKINSGEYKAMGLAPYGKPRYVDIIMENLIDLKWDGSFKLNMKYFGYLDSLRMYNKKFEVLFGGPKRKGESKLEQRHFDIARSIQAVTEEVMLRMARHLYDETHMDNLCLAGGVTLNAVANGRVVRETPFKNVFIHPAAGDAGGAYGVAAYIWHKVCKNPVGQRMEMPYYGCGYSESDIERFLENNDVIYYRARDDKELIEITAGLIDSQRVVGWFQGGMEWGPRALGNRSILADPRDAKMRDIVNIKIKFRESFRPFAPTVLWEHAKEWFDLECESPYMLMVAPVKKDVIPAVTHVDKSARVQTLKREDNPKFYGVIEEFYKLTGVPVVINTSFNVRGEPIVRTPEDAYKCFMRTNMDYLAIGNFLVGKGGKEKIDIREWENAYPLD